MKFLSFESSYYRLSTTAAHHQHAPAQNGNAANRRAKLDDNTTRKRLRLELARLLSLLSTRRLDAETRRRSSKTERFVKTTNRAAGGNTTDKRLIIAQRTKKRPSS